MLEVEKNGKVMFYGRFGGEVLDIFFVDRSRSMLRVILSMMVVICSISASSVFSLMRFVMIPISSVMDFNLFCQYSRRILVRVNPKFCWASSQRS